MPDTRFFKKSSTFTLAEIASISKATLGVAESASHVMHNVAPLETATAQDISFFDNKKYLSAFLNTKAGACFVSKKYANQLPAGTIALIAEEPYKAYALTAQAFYPEATATNSNHHPRASIAETAVIGENTTIEANAVIGENAVIGKNCIIKAGAVIDANVIIGANSFIGANAVVQFSIIGDYVIIYPGACIGQSGFGFAFDKDKPVKVPQLGRVIIEDYVEIGANTTIDRGAGPDTIIKRGAMIDNQVQIGHNVVIGKNAVIVAHAGISGSTHIGDYAQLGGKAGLTGHLQIGTGARIAAGSGVMRDVANFEAVGGSPAMPIKQWLRQTAILDKLARKKVM